MKIGVFGDSFADRRHISSYINTDRGDESWINQIQLQGHDITTYGAPGTSCWYSYKKFLEHHMLYSHVVFCYSYTHRIHYLPAEYEKFTSFIGQVNHLHLSGTFNNLNIEQQNEIRNLIKSLEIVKDEMLDKFICQNIFDQVNQICKIKRIRLVNILPFENKTISTLDLTNRQGDCLTNLLQISLKELPDFGSGSFSDPRYCHLSLENNNVLANIVLSSLNKPLKQIIDLYELPEFLYDRKITNRYMNIIRQDRRYQKGYK